MCLINLENIFSFKNGYICTKQTDKSYYYRRHEPYRVQCTLFAPNALAKRCSLALCVGNTLCIRYQLATFYTIRTQLKKKNYVWTVRRFCVTGTNFGQ